MKKLIFAFVFPLLLITFSGNIAQAKNCIGYCPGSSSNSGNPYKVYKPRNTYVAPYSKSNGQYVQGYTRSKPLCSGWYCP